jgi:hypothetical protein
VSGLENNGLFRLDSMQHIRGLVEMKMSSAMPCCKQVIK